MTRTVSIDPTTRLEGHGRIHLHLDDDGRLEAARLQIPELRGFEKLCEGRAAEEMPTLTAKICGICPTAHHLAAAHALDDLYGAEPPEAARLQRRLVYAAFMFEDHLLHTLVLGGPDLFVSPDAPLAERSVFGVVRALGETDGKALMGCRHRVRELHGRVSGSPLYPVFAVPGGVTKPLTEADRDAMIPTTAEAVVTAQRALELLHARVMTSASFREALDDPELASPTWHLGSVSEGGDLEWLDGSPRVIDQQGETVETFAPSTYGERLIEHDDPHSFGRLVGFAHGGVEHTYRSGPLARLNACTRIPTPRAEAQRTAFFDTLGGRPVHHPLAHHWARLIEVLHAAEIMAETVRADPLTDPDVRRPPTREPEEGIGACEAPRGLLIHHYRTDSRGILSWVNLVVGTQNSLAAIGLDLEAAARKWVRGPAVSPGARGALERILRAYDPCFACTTHAVGPGREDPIKVWPSIRTLSAGRNP